MPGIPNLVMDEHHQHHAGPEPEPEPEPEPTDWVPYKERALAAEAKIGELLAEREKVMKLIVALYTVRDAADSEPSEWTLVRIRSIISGALKD